MAQPGVAQPWGDGGSGAVVFDLDEDDAPPIEAVAVDRVPESAVFDLDDAGPMGALVIDIDGGGVADLPTFDLQETVLTPEEAWADRDTYGAVEDHDDDLDDDAMYTPPDDTDNDDIAQAQADMRHIEAMGQYMFDRGVTDVP